MFDNEELNKVLQPIYQIVSGNGALAKHPKASIILTELCRKLKRIKSQ